MGIQLSDGWVRIGLVCTWKRRGWFWLPGISGVTWEIDLIMKDGSVFVFVEVRPGGAFVWGAD